jgi:catechol 2,3-dioxygenase-like lactoylglutathione lyase family enzyme
MTNPLPPTGGLPGEIHHFGLACRDIADDLALFAALGFRPEGEPFTDEIQGVRGQFAVCGNLRIEFLEPLGEAQTLRPWLRNGSRFYHVALQIGSRSEAESQMRKLGAIRLGAWSPASAFDGGQIAFFALRNGLLAELIEK